MKRRLLFVDDDVDVRDAFADLLEFSGWSVAHAGDGEEALDWLRAHEVPSVILLDLKMPRCDGYSFRQRQLADARLCGIPTVIFTADAKVDAVHLPSLDGTWMVRKSAPFAELQAVLERASGPE
jgi:CheY-like chemotaxis protein